jgi:hypothetical protein
VKHATLYAPRWSTIADRPPALFRYGLADHDATVRLAEPHIAAGYSEREVWAALFTDEQRIAIHRTVHGNLKGGRRRTRAPWVDPPAPTLFGGAA